MLWQCKYADHRLFCTVSGKCVAIIWIKRSQKPRENWIEAVKSRIFPSPKSATTTHNKNATEEPTNSSKWHQNHWNRTRKHYNALIHSITKHRPLRIMRGRNEKNYVAWKQQQKVRLKFSISPARIPQKKKKK